MKKILAVFMTLAALITCSACVLADEKLLDRADIPVMSDEDTAAKGLKELGILRGTGENLELGRNVTRAEATALIMRMHYEAPEALGMPSSEFTDLDGHWAYKEVTAAKKMGLVDGVGNGLFEPDRTVTGREFTKMLLSVLGYSDITIENTYDKGLACDLLINNFTKSVVSGNYTLLRGDCARLMWSAFFAKPVSGGLYYNKLIEAGRFTKEDFYGILIDAAEISAERSFADKLNAEMPKDKNYMFSPMSIKMALSLAANGASGNTQTEILNTLGLTSPEEFNSVSKDLIERYSQTDILSLNIANSIWVNKDKTSQNFSDDFKSIAAEYYNADVNTVTNADAVGKINSWVNDKTKGKITQIVQTADDFWAMLVNAIYFKGAWQDEFNEGATKPDEFTNADGTKSQIDFMNKTRWFPYAETKSVKIIELSYKNRVDKISDSGEYLGTDKYDNLDVSMYLIASDGDINPEQELNAAIGAEQFKSTYIKMSVPKFKIEYSTSLNDILKNLGIVSAFNTNAEFEKMFDKGNMWFTNTLHKTYINVDEKGTEAAAVTAIGMAGSAMPPEPIELKFNKPFCFIIRDNTCGETLFMGRFACGSIQ